MKKTVGIITFHCVDDYGGMLQAYASKTYLNNKEYRAEMINYSPIYMTGRYWFFPYQKNKKIKEIIKNVYQNNIKHIKTFVKRKRAMRKFRKNCIKPIGKKIYTTKGLEKCEYDTYYFGSDQIWNPKITYKIQPAYFAEFKKPKTSKCIAYAASIGKEELDSKYNNQIKKYLKNFDAISLREESSTAYISTLTNTKLEYVADPTLLLSEEEWLKVTKKPNEENYILVYFTEQNEDLIQYAYKLSKEKKLKVIVLNIKFKDKLENFKVKADNGPSEFLGYIKNANYVITNSFHATVFAIIFKKQMGIFLHKTLGVRLKDLIDKLGLTNRIINPNFNIEEKINWEEIEQNKIKFIQSSEKFIEDNV